MAKLCGNLIKIGHLAVQGSDFLSFYIKFAKEYLNVSSLRVLIWAT